MDAHVGIAGEDLVDLACAAVKLGGDLPGGDPAVGAAVQSLHDAAVKLGTLGKGLGLREGKLRLMEQADQKHFQVIGKQLQPGSVEPGILLGMLQKPGPAFGEVLPQPPDQLVHGGLLGLGQYEGRAFQPGKQGAAGVETHHQDLKAAALHRPEPVQLHGAVKDHVALLQGVDPLLAGHPEGALQHVDHFPEGVELPVEVVGMLSPEQGAGVEFLDAKDGFYGNVEFHGRTSMHKMKENMANIIYTYDFDLV